MVIPDYFFTFDLKNISMALKQTHFTLPGQTSFYKGKVRDVYTLDSQLLVMVVSDRISAFDVVLPEPIPFKGQVLNQIAAYFLELSRDIVPNWVVAVPDPNVTVGLICDTFPVEMVIRGYLAGHAWRTYESGGRLLCGIVLPEGLTENDRLPCPIITPTTKASLGHDEDISREELIASGTITSADFDQLAEYTFKLFEFGTRKAAEQGLVLVDTKYEFGRHKNQIYLIDEIHTPDSSRYFYADTYEHLQHAGLPQRQLSKEFVRKWLIENGFQGLEGQQVPLMNKDKIEEISARYIELYEKITGTLFIKNEQADITNRVEKNIVFFLTNNSYHYIK